MAGSRAAAALAAAAAAAAVLASCGGCTTGDVPAPEPEPRGAATPPPPPDASMTVQSSMPAAATAAASAAAAGAGAAEGAAPPQPTPHGPLLLREDAPSLLLKHHVAYLMAVIRKGLPPAMEGLDSNRLTMLHFAVAGLDLLGQRERLAPFR